MTSTLLSFRFEPSKMPAQTLVRDRLLSTLETAAKQRLTLLLAPAGSGKTLLLSQWQNSQRLPIAWLNLSDKPITPANLIYGLVFSLRKLSEVPKKLGEVTLAALASLSNNTTPDDLEHLLLPLMAELKADLKSPSQLVIDAAENLADSNKNNAATLKLVDLLLQALPSKLSLILASRTYLPLKQLAHLQLTDQLTLIQRQDLDFTQDEIRQLFKQLNKTLQLGLVTSIWQQTLGWPAALKFICQNDNLEAVRPYLQQEVIAPLSNQERQLLELLAGLDAASASLLSELTGNPVAEEQLTVLATMGLLITTSAVAKCVMNTTQTKSAEPWFKLHPLLLRLVFQKDSPPSASDKSFHKLTAQALAKRELFFPAAQQAFLAAQTTLLASYMQKLGSHLLRSLDPTQFLVWRTSLPNELIAASAELTFISCWALLFANQTQAAQALLTKSKFNQLPEAKLINCYLLASEQHTEQAMQEALALYPQLKDSQPEVAIHALLLITRWHTSHNLLRAARGFNREAQMLAHQAQSPELEQLLAYDQINLEINKGHLRLAEHLLDEALQLPSNQPLPRGRLLLLKGYLYWCQGQIPLATQFLEEAIALLKPSGDQHLISGYLILSLVARSSRNLIAAFDWLGEAERTLHLQHPASVSWQPILTALKASLWLDEGKLDLALTWLQQLVDKAPEPSLVQLPLQNQLLQLLYGRALMSHRRYDQALELLNNQLKLTADYPVAGLFVQVHKALALKHSRQNKEALSTLREALQLAEPENFCMPFLSADSSLLELLLPLKEQLASGSTSLKFVQHLLSQVVQPSANSSGDPTRPLEELSVREEQVLILVAEGLANKEIAQRLFISLHTVKTHVRHILRKLDVSSRTQALTRARELRLL